MKPTNPNLLSISSVAFLLITLFQPAAFSWGPEAHRSIALSAYQILQYDLYEIAKSGEVSYEMDLLRGAMDGRGIVEESLSINDDKQAIDAIDYEVQLLRAVREHGVGSHFAYRLGTLSALVADVMHPFGIAYTPEQEKLKEMIDVDIEEAIYSQDVDITRRSNDYITSAEKYVTKTRQFQLEDQVLIRDEYRRGINFRGYAGTAMGHYYERAVEAVVDIWYTIMSPTVNPRAPKPSQRVVTWYFVNEVKYLLNVRQNIDYANRAYQVYEKVNPGIIETHLVLGDTYYDFGTHDSRVVGVAEWVKVQQTPGIHRKKALTRLSRHYIEEGDTFMAHSRSPESMESDLSEALHSFKLAMQYDRTNAGAATKITETSVVILERKKEYTLQQQYIDGAMLSIQEAEKSRLDKDYSNTLFAYDQSLNALSWVDTQFRDLDETAKETISRVKKDKKSTIREVIDNANSSLEIADTAQLNGNFDEAILNYRSVKSLVSVIRDPGTVDKQTIAALIESSDLGISDTEISRDRANRNQAQRPGTQL